MLLIIFMSINYWNDIILDIYCVYVCVYVLSYSVVSDSLWPHELGSSVHEIFQARIQKWGAISSSRGTSQPRDQTSVTPALAGGFFITEPPGKPINSVELLLTTVTHQNARELVLFLMMEFLNLLAQVPPQGF